MTTFFYDLAIKSTHLYATAHKVLSLRPVEYNINIFLVPTNLIYGQRALTSPLFTDMP